MSPRRGGALVVLAALGPAAFADTYPRQPGVDAIHYVFRVALHDEVDAIEGEATVQLRFLRDGVGEVALDLASAADGKGMTVASVSAGDKLLAFGHAANRLTVKLPEASRAGRELAMTVRYSGVPASGLRILPNRYGERSFFSENWPDHARGWLPMIDHPYDKATGEFVVTAPAQYQVVANGVLVEQDDLPQGMRRTHWKQSVPIASWLFALGVARFDVHHAGEVEGVPLQSWVFPQNRDLVVAGFEQTARPALAFFSEHIGPYAYEKLANVQAAGLNGGTEHASAIFYGENSVTGRPIVSLVAHEIAHQWFGDSVTESDWDDVWLSEGFATYFTLLLAEHAEGRQAFVSGLMSSRERVLKLDKTLPDTPVIHRNLADMSKVLNQLVYQKGGWTLHMLRAQIGTDAFWRGIREYYRRYRDQNATTDDFRRVLEQASGQELSWFFDQWLRRAGVPVLGGSWRYEARENKVHVTLAQTQPGEPFRLPIEIAADGAREPARLEMRERSASLSIAVDREPATVTLDPGTWLLFEPGPFARTR